MKRLGKYILINILFIGLCGCEQNERIEYMLYIENHSADTIRLKRNPEHWLMNVL